MIYIRTILDIKFGFLIRALNFLAVLSPLLFIASFSNAQDSAANNQLSSSGGPLSVDVPWKIEGNLINPKRGAKLKCSVVDMLCNTGGGMAVAVGINAGVGGVAKSGTERITIGAAEAQDAIAVTCELEAPGLKSGPESVNTQPIPGRSASCLMQDDTGKWIAHDLVEMQKIMSDRAKARAQAMADRRKQVAAQRKTQQAEYDKAEAEKKRLEAIARKRAADAKRKAAQDAKNNKSNEPLIKGKTRAEWEKIWKSLEDETEKTAFEGSAYGRAGMKWENRPIIHAPYTRQPPEYCEKDKHCTFGHYHGFLGLEYDQEFQGKCIDNVCRENQRTNLEPNGSPCTSTAECDNKGYEGQCVKGVCKSVKRASCETPGTRIACTNSITAQSGYKICRDDKVYGTCSASIAPPTKLTSAKNKKTTTTSKTNQTNSQDKFAGKTRAEWAKIWAQNADKSEKAAHDGSPQYGGKGKKYEDRPVFPPPSFDREPPAYCEKDAHCQISHNYGPGNILESKEYWGRCVKNRCVENTLTNIDTQGSQCSTDSQCDNIKYAGICTNNKCVSSERKKCTSPGKVLTCNDPFTGDAGIAICGKNGTVGTCKPNSSFASNFKNAGAEYNKNAAEWNKFLAGVVPRKNSGLTDVDPNRSLCEHTSECSNTDFTGRCVPNSNGKKVCKSTKRGSCQNPGAVERCVPMAKWQGDVGYSMCVKSERDTLKWTDCVGAKAIKSSITELKRQNKWGSWGSSN